MENVITITSTYNYGYRKENRGWPFAWEVVPSFLERVGPSILE